MKNLFAMVVILLLAGCGGNGGGSAEIPPVPSLADLLAAQSASGQLGVGVMNLEAAQYRLWVATLDTTTAQYTFTDVWNPTTTGPDTLAVFLAIPPTSATTKHHFLLNTTGFAFLDMSTEFIRTSQYQTIYVKIEGQEVTWSLDGSAPWN